MADDWAARLLALEDREAIRDLIVRYGPLADSGDAAAVAALWAADGTYAVDGFPEAKGHAAIAALITRPVHQELLGQGCAHVLSSPVIQLCVDTAQAHCYSIVLRHQGDAWEPWRVAANRWQLQRMPAGWRVVRRDNALLDGRKAARVLLAIS